MQVLAESKRRLLQCAAPDAVVRLEHTSLPAAERKSLQREYLKDQHHDSLAGFLQHRVVGAADASFVQVRGHSNAGSEVTEMQGQRSQ